MKMETQKIVNLLKFWASICTITDAKHYVPIVTISTEDNAKLSKLLSEGFKRPVYWNEYSVIEEK